MLANNGDNVDCEGNNDGIGWLGKCVRKLENGLAYLMEYHVLNGLHFSARNTNFVNQVNVRNRSAETESIIIMLHIKSTADMNRR